MRSMLKPAVLVLCVLAIAGTASLASAMPGMMGRGGWDRETSLERLDARLDLTDEQVAAIKKVREERSVECMEYRVELLRIQDEIRGEMLEDNPDIDKLKKLIVSREKIRTSMNISRVEGQLAIREILTPEQCDRLLLLRNAGWRSGFCKEGRRPGYGRMDRGRGWRDGSRSGKRPGSGSRRCWGW
jgi:Spy/CpxP family protein refolding chaperone